MKKTLIWTFVILGILSTMFGRLPMASAQEIERSSQPSGETPPGGKIDPLAPKPTEYLPFNEGELPKYGTPAEVTYAPGFSIPDFNENKLAEFTQFSLTPTRSVSPLSGLINVANDSGVPETHSATAHGGDHIVVAYMKNQEIYASVLTENGIFQGSFMVSNGHQRSAYPEIAYEASNDLFVIVWQYDYYADYSDYDILIRTISADTNTTVGDCIPVAKSGSHEMNPSVACNNLDSSCLVVYEYENSGFAIRNIQGRFMDITTAGVSSTSPNAFDISTLYNENNPHVAWGPAGYLVAYTWPATGGGEKFPVFQKLYGTYQTTGNQYLFGPTKLFNTGVMPNNTDKFPTSVAYDFGANKFLVTFTYDYYGNSSDFDTYFVIVNGGVSNITLGVVIIANSSAQETSADICYMKDVHLSYDNQSPGNLAVVYSRSGSTVFVNGIVATILKGNKDLNAPAYAFEASSEHLVLKEPFPSLGSLVNEPSLTGSTFGNKVFATLTNVKAGTVWEYDIVGRIFGAQKLNYLPLIIR